jgi:adenylate kinase
MESGAYVPDEITVEMLRQRLQESDAVRGFILDGFPRTEPQVAALDQLIGEDGLHTVVLFEVDEDELTERLLSRGRLDDSEETIRHRLKVYEEQTAPLISLYESRDIVVRVDGSGTLEEVTNRVLRAVTA